MNHVGVWEVWLASAVALGVGADFGSTIDELHSQFSKVRLIADDVLPSHVVDSLMRLALVEEAAVASGASEAASGDEQDQQIEEEEEAASAAAAAAAAMDEEGKGESGEAQALSGDHTVHLPVSEDSYEFEDALCVDKEQEEGKDVRQRGCIAYLATEEEGSLGRQAQLVQAREQGHRLQHCSFGSTAGAPDYAAHQPPAVSSAFSAADDFAAPPAACLSPSDPRAAAVSWTAFQMHVPYSMPAHAGHNTKPGTSARTSFDTRTGVSGRTSFDAKPGISGRTSFDTRIGPTSGRTSLDTRSSINPSLGAVGSGRSSLDIGASLVSSPVGPLFHDPRRRSPWSSDGREEAPRCHVLAGRGSGCERILEGGVGIQGAGAAEEGDRGSTHLSGDRGSVHLSGDRGSIRLSGDRAHLLAPDRASGSSLGYGRSVKGPRSLEDTRRRSVDVSRRSTETSRRSLDDAAMYAEEHPNACVLFAGGAALGGDRMQGV